MLFWLIIIDKISKVAARSLPPSRCLQAHHCRSTLARTSSSSHGITGALARWSWWLSMPSSPSLSSRGSGEHPPT
jgi:hypothetical protein